MNKNDYSYAQEVTASFKKCIISNIYSTGQLSQRFQVRFEDIKIATNRVRLSPSIIQDYIYFFEQQGISVFTDNIFSIMCEVCLTDTYLTPEEALEVSNNMEAYNTKIAYDLANLS